MRDKFSAGQVESLKRSVAALNQLLPLLDQASNQGELVMALTELTEASREAYVASGALYEYERKAAGRAARRLNP
jgi:hypothetical protein